MHLGGVGLHADVVEAGGGEGGGEVAGPPSDVEQGAARRRCPVRRSPQIGDHRGGVVGERAVKAGGFALFEAELAEQPERP